MAGRLTELVEALDGLYGYLDSLDKEISGMVADRYSKINALYSLGLQDQLIDELYRVYEQFRSQVNKSSEILTTEVMPLVKHYRDIADQF